MLDLAVLDLPPKVQLNRTEAFFFKNLLDPILFFGRKTDGKTTIGCELPGGRNQKKFNARVFESLFGLHNPVHGVENCHQIVFPHHEFTYTKNYDTSVSPAQASSSVDRRERGEVNCVTFSPAVSGSPKGFTLTLHQSLNMINYLFLAFLGNLPLGYLRESSSKYSLRWFIYIHLSIPFLVALRVFYDFGWAIVPFSIGCAVAGQLLGGRFKRRNRS